MRRTRIAALAVSAALMVGLSGCGGDDSSGDAGDGAREKGERRETAQRSTNAVTALKAVSRSTRNEDSARVEGTQSQTLPGGTESHVTTKGAMDWSEGGITGNLDVTQSGGAVQGSPIDGKALPARYTPDAMYLNMGDDFAREAGGGAHWIKYDYDVLAKKAGASGSFVKDQLQNNNPSRSVELLLAAGKVRKVGEESVRGTPTTHYSGTVDIAELAKLQSTNLSEQELESLRTQLRQTGLTSQRIDLWVDGDDLLVKKRESGKSEQGDSSFDSTVHYSDYGTSVKVSEPSSSDTVDFEKIG